MLLIGGLMMALAIEQSQLHKRVALKVLIFMGPKPVGYVKCLFFISFDSPNKSVLKKLNILRCISSYIIVSLKLALMKL